MWTEISRCFSFVFPWWLLILSTFSHACWLFAHFLWKLVYLCPLSTLKLGYLFFLLSGNNFLHILSINSPSMWFVNILSHSTGCQKSSFSTFVPGLNLDCLSPTVYVPQVVTFEHLLCPAIQSLTLILQFLYSSSFSSTLWLAWFHKCPLVEVLPWILVPLEMALISWLVH